MQQCFLKIILPLWIANCPIPVIISLQNALIDKSDMTAYFSFHIPVSYTCFNHQGHPHRQCQSEVHSKQIPLQGHALITWFAKISQLFGVLKIQHITKRVLMYSAQILSISGWLLFYSAFQNLFNMSIKVVHLFGAILVLQFFAKISCCPQAYSANKKKPNIVFILVDDLVRFLFCLRVREQFEARLLTKF